MSKNNTLKNLIIDRGTRPLIPKSNKLDPKFFDEKFSMALVKTLQLKGMNLKITESDYDAIHLPQLDDLPTRIQLNPFDHEESSLGLIAFDDQFLSELIHKMMGGSDNIEPGPIQLPMGALQQRVVDSFAPALANCIREGVKNSLGLESISMGASIEPIAANDLLNKSGDAYIFRYTFKGLMTSSIVVILFIKKFNAKITP